MNVQADNQEPHWQASATRTLNLILEKALALLKLRGPSVLLALVCMCGDVQSQDSPEDRTLLSMCRAGLAESAILYAKAQIDLASSDGERRTWWTARLIECYAQAALRAEASSQDYWQSCVATYDKSEASDPNNARLPWLKWQRSRCDLLHAQSALARYLAAPAQLEPKETALELVRKIQKDMEDLEQDIKRRQPIAARQSLAGGTQAPAEQLAKLAVDVSLMRCESLLIRARLYDPGSRDRVAAATDVESLATNVLKSTGDDWPSRGQLQVAHATSLLDLGRSEEALNVLTSLARESSQPSTSVRAAVLAIEYLANHQQTSRARGLLPLLSAVEAGPEFELASMQLELAEIPSMNEARKNESLNQLVANARTLGERYGDYWRSRAEALLVGSVSTESMDSSSGVTLELMTVEVRQLLAAGKTDEAIGKLLQFRDTEAKAKRGESAIKLAAQASVLLQRQQAWLAAADALEQTCLQFPQAVNASASHVLAVWSLSQLLRKEANDQPLKVRYEQALRNQLMTWPEAQASEEPALWLKSWLVGQQRTLEFADLLLQQSSRIQSTAMLQTKMLDWVLLVLSLPDASHRRASAGQLVEQIDANKFGAHSDIARVAQLVVVAFSQWPNAQESQFIDSQLARLKTGTLPDEPERTLLIAVQLLRTAQRNRLDEAARLATQWQPEELSIALRVALSQALVDAIDETPLDTHAQWAQALKFDSVWAEGLLGQSALLPQALGYRISNWLGSSQVSLDGLARLTKSSPRDGQLQLQLSSALADLGKDRLADSTRIARQVIASSTAGSELNLAARWRLLKNLRLLGSAEQAKQAAQLLVAAQPIESEVWRQRFEQAAQ